jgi:NAD(P)-dependent dehydrogenase (short-subunit alcohol dehydrogenase family)
MTEEMRGKVAVVTGGGAGIGLASAEKLAREGASVVVCSDREDQARQAAGGLREEGLEVTEMRGDVTSSAERKSVCCMF